MTEEKVIFNIPRRHIRDTRLITASLEMKAGNTYLVELFDANGDGWGPDSFVEITARPQSEKDESPNKEAGWSKTISDPFTGVIVRPPSNKGGRRLKKGKWARPPSKRGGRNKKGKWARQPPKRDELPTEAVWSETFSAVNFNKNERKRSIFVLPSIEM